MAGHFCHRGYPDYGDITFQGGREEAACKIFGNKTIPLQNHVDILGVEGDSCLQFDCHLQIVGHTVSQMTLLLKKKVPFRLLWPVDSLQNPDQA